jgi:N-acetylneuraminic acid mutarotase
MSLVDQTRKLCRAAGVATPVVESLEGRTLLHAGHLHVNVNFQPAAAAVPAGYLADGGAAFGNRGNGWNYGWDLANTGGVRDRNKLADQRYDTINHTQSYGSREWEIDVPNGLYTVKIVAGDAGYFDSVFKFNVESTLVVSGTPTTTTRFIEGTKTVSVTDGRLTISNASGAVNNKIAFVEIASAEPALPTVSVSAADSSAAEPGTNTGAFRFTRTGGDTTQSLVVAYTIAGSASNGSDYQQLLGTVTIPAGGMTALVTIKPIDDATAEATETVVLSVKSSTAYTAATGTATVSIADNDSATGLFAAKINFQPTGVPIPAGYTGDGGQLYNARNGLTYGWIQDNTQWGRDRNLLADQRYDTLNHLTTKTWELAVPSGTYSVKVVSGDAAYFDSVYKTMAEGVLVVDGTPTSASRFVEGTKNVTVTDGRLTLTAGAGAVNNKINFIEVTQVTTQPALPTVTVSAPTTNASENGPTSRAFTITRSGATTSALAVYFTIGGTANNGGDYAVINSPVTIPAGSASVTVNVNPIDDPHVENVETAVLTLVAHASYTVGAASNATIRINDNDTPVGNTITWTTRAANPSGRAEALKAVVDGRLYVFGGFGGSGPVNRHDVYDPLTNVWSPRAPVPTRLTHAGVAVDGRDIFVAGGYIGTSSTGTGWAQKFGVTDVWKYNVDANAWTAVTPKLPKEVAGGGLVLLGRELHWVSGNDNQRKGIGDHFALNLDNLAAGWKTLAPLPSGRSHLGVVTLNGKIYAVGGQFGNDSLLTTQKFVHVWDPANPTVWTPLAGLPTAVSHIASSTFVFGGRIIVAGGETAHTKATDLVYAYDPVKNEWAAMSKLPAARFSGVAAEIGGEIYFTTGSNQTTTWKGVVS